MKFVVLFSVVLVGCLVAQADSKSLFVSGTVPYRGDIEIKTSPDGKIAIQQNSPDKLKIETLRRGPASVISVSAP